MIKASELKKNQITLKQVEDFLEPLIFATNREGRTSLRTYGPEGIFGDPDLYGSILIESVLKMLRNHGYIANICHDFSQFGDSYLKISWK
jgi:hypothetical protein